MKVKNCLFLMRRSPAAAGTEAFDLALTASAFDQDVTLVFADEAVYWLSLGLPPLLAEAVEEIAVERESLSERGVPALTLPDDCKTISRAELAEAIAAAELVVAG